LILKALQRNGPLAYTEALRAIPHGTRALFLQAYQVISFSLHPVIGADGCWPLLMDPFQSLIFNRLASVRLQMSRAPMVGDLVSNDK